MQAVAVLLLRDKEKGKKKSNWKKAHLLKQALDSIWSKGRLQAVGTG